MAAPKNDGHYSRKKKPEIDISFYILNDGYYQLVTDGSRPYKEKLLSIYNKGNAVEKLLEANAKQFFSQISYVHHQSRYFMALTKGDELKVYYVAPNGTRHSSPPKIVNEPLPPQEEEESGEAHHHNSPAKESQKFKIAMLGYIGFYEEMVRVGRELGRLGHDVKYPAIIEGMKEDQPEIKRKVMFEHFERIKWADAVLVLNVDKNGIPGYVGESTLMEITVALFLNKKIFFYKDWSRDILPYSAELSAVQPVIIHENVKLIS